MLCYNLFLTIISLIPTIILVNFRLLVNLTKLIIIETSLIVKL